MKLIEALRKLPEDTMIIKRKGRWSIRLTKDPASKAINAIDIITAIQFFLEDQEARKE